VKEYPSPGVSRLLHPSWFLSSLGAARVDHMTNPSDPDSGSSARGEAAWKEATEEVAARNRRTQRMGREQREAYERERRDARRAAEARAYARLLDGREASAPERLRRPPP
jgi:hypothetical protein